jgi:F-type H+-transporting ATPase subunit b
MHIDWFTVIAEVINFLVLVWLLKRFLYRPVLKAIEERENKIAAQLQDAEIKKAEAKKEQDEFKQKNAEFDKQKQELMQKAVADSDQQRAKLLEEARNQANTLRANLEKALKEDQENKNQDIAQKTKEQVLIIARRALSEIASSSLEEQSVNTFIKRLVESKTEEKKQFIEAFKSDSNPLLVQSAFDLPDKQQTEITNAIDETLGAKTQLQFKTKPALISGIELTTNGYKLAWSVSDYLASLEKKLPETKNEKLKEPAENI